MSDSGGKSGLHLPSTVSTQSCRPRFCWGFITQWLLVAVMSKTSQPPSDAWTFLESSKNVSASLKVEEHNEGKKQNKTSVINKPQFKWCTHQPWKLQLLLHNKNHKLCLLIIKKEFTIQCTDVDFWDYHFCVSDQTDDEMNVATLRLHYKQITKPLQQFAK